jgi:hypothetical protein
MDDPTDSHEADDEPQVFETLEEAVAYAKQRAERLPMLIDHAFFLQNLRVKGMTPKQMHAKYNAFTLKECEQILAKRIRLDAYGWPHGLH